ncbi:endoplasmic reticulum chaperone BiP-like [Haliotis rubra]|uniref:endoplasmic reticulum chaperone BiP-like n=1 Tax=Haliotis rubra TaxID=36100 RepID=UPI001EE50E6B|nr:endoplasmic reticulum chaperone BiP-like [Haliotis rubra]XP_046554872.1 endoplasmic reticulum chaperone BiP-like [Haliotis rubra]
MRIICTHVALLLLTTCWHVQACITARNEIQEPVIGIDLGTAFTCVGVVRNDQVEIIPDQQGNWITPSYVAFTPDGETLIGHAAKNQMTTNPENTIFDVKRLIGRTWDDPSVQRDIKRFPFKVIHKENKPYIEVRVGSEDKVFAPEEISAMLLSKMKEMAETYLGENVTNAVVTVPAYFNDAQRTATKDAGTIAGLNVLRIINEPTAAAFAYGLDKLDGETNVLVFDLGVGTFDVSIITIDHGVFEVVATNGDTHLGSQDIDQRLIEYFIKQYKTRTGQDLLKNSGATQKLRREVEKAKRALSSQHQTRVEIESIMGGHDFSEVLTRAKLEELNMDLFKSTLNYMQSALDEAYLNRTDIHEIVMVGESSEIPKIQQLVKEFLDGKEPNRGINPEEVVAYGAAVHGRVMAEDGDNDIILCDSSPLSLGIETIGGVMAKVIGRNSFIPTRRTEQFTTTEHDQDEVTIRVYEGERAMTKNNLFLGQFDLTGIQPASRGVPLINVTIEIDVNGIVYVTAEEIGTGNKNNIIIKYDVAERPSPEYLEKMIQDAEEFADEDKEMMEKAEADLRAGDKWTSRKAVRRKPILPGDPEIVSRDEL